MNGNLFVTEAKNGRRSNARHRDLASALLHDDGGLSGAIRCANIFAHCRSRVGDAQESAHPILGRNNAFVVGWSDTDQLRRTFRGWRGVALASRCKRQTSIAHRRHHSSPARSPLCELHAKLSEPDSARGRPRSNVFSKGSNHSHSNKFTARGGKRTFSQMLKRRCAVRPNGTSTPSVSKCAVKLPKATRGRATRSESPATRGRNRPGLRA